MPLSTVARDAAVMLGYGHENADALWKQFLIDGSVLVWDGTTNGKGSENYVDDARKLSPEHLKFIDDFICETHAAGGTVSVPTCADELADELADERASARGRRRPTGFRGTVTARSTAPA